MEGGAVAGRRGERGAGTSRLCRSSDRHAHRNDEGRSGGASTAEPDPALTESKDTGNWEGSCVFAAGSANQTQLTTFD